MSEAPKMRRLRAREVPTIGWVLISRKEVAKAEELLLGDNKGVVDELGLLGVHQAIADRLFPGTSVLHTRLRYVLFVPWLLKRAASSSNPASSLTMLESQLALHLIHGTQGDPASRKGIIGAKVVQRGQHAAQPPSYSYWTALSAWGILGRDHVNSIPSRDSILQSLSAGSERGVDESGMALAPDGLALFEGLPKEPDEFLENRGGFTFALLPEEKKFLRNRLTAVKRVDTGSESLLAILARTPEPFLSKAAMDESLSLWSPSVRKLAGSDDQRVIELARRAGAMGGLARAIYLALVERACAAKKIAFESKHEDRLTSLRESWAKDARGLDLDELEEMKLGLADARLKRLMASVQHWLDGSVSLKSLVEIFREVESGKKKERARLTGTPLATSSLRRWAEKSNRSGEPDRLHFRWPQVMRLMKDLHGA